MPVRMISLINWPTVRMVSGRGAQMAMPSKVLSPDGTQVYFSGTGQLPGRWRFLNSVPTAPLIQANGQTFDVPRPVTVARDPKPNAPKYKVVARTGEAPKIILDSLATGPGRPFIGTTDIVDNNLYKVEAYTDNSMTPAALEGSEAWSWRSNWKSGYCWRWPIKTSWQAQQSKAGKLDPAPGANAIIVGTESRPFPQYYGGGPLDATCKRMTSTLSPAQTLLIIMPTEPVQRR